MNEDQVDGLFALAEIDIIKKHQLVNRYWPPSEHYDAMRRENPWWLVETEYGRIEVGKRKRVYFLNWTETYTGAGEFKATPFRQVVTPEKDKWVTHDETMTHAWGLPALLRYLILLRQALVKACEEASKPAPQGDNKTT